MGSPEDGIHLPILDEVTAWAFVHGLWLPLYPNLRELYEVKDELSEVTLIDQFLKVLSEGATVHREVAASVVESTVVSRSVSPRVM